MPDNDDLISSLLANSRTVAVVGLSSRPDRPSHAVAQYLQSHGYRVIPVNPTYAGTRILGEHCYPSLTLANATLADEGVAIELVDCFRKSVHVGAIVDEAIAIGAHGVWMQLGVVDSLAADRAQQAGLAVVMDKCIKIEHMRLQQGLQ